VAARLRGGEGGGAKVQWFLIGFIAASVIAWLAPAPGAWTALAALGKALMVPTLFMVGATTLTPDSLRTVGVRPLVMGVVLWAIVSAMTAVFVLGGVLSIG